MNSWDTQPVEQKIWFQNNFSDILDHTMLTKNCWKFFSKLVLPLWLQAHIIHITSFKGQWRLLYIKCCIIIRFEFIKNYYETIWLSASCDSMFLTQPNLHALRSFEGQKSILYVNCYIRSEKIKKYQESIWILLSSNGHKLNLPHP